MCPLKTYLSLLGLLIPSFLFTQILRKEPLIERLYGRSGQDKFQALTQNWLGEVAAVGQTKRGIYGGSDIYLLLMDDELKRKSEFYIGRSGDDGAQRIHQDMDGRYLIAGYSSTPSGKANKRYFGKKDAWLLTVNEQGQTEQELILGSKDDDEFVEVLLLSNGDKLLIGNTGEQAWLLRISAQQKVVWEKRIQYHGLPTQAKGATLGADEQVYIVGFAKEEGIQKMWLSAFDAHGVQSWGKIFPAGQAAEGNNIIAIDDQALAITGYVNTEDHREEGFYCRIDSRGNVQAYKKIGGREDDRLTNLSLLHNGEIALIGHSQSFIRGSRRPTVWIVLVDQDGFTREEAFYGSKTNDEGCALLQRSDGSLIALGLSNQQVLKATQGWIAQVSEKQSSSTQLAALSTQHHNLIYPNGQFLGPGQRAYFPMHLSAPPGKGLVQLKARITLQHPDSTVVRNIVLPPRPPHQTVPLPIPIVLNLPHNLQREIPLEVQVFQGKQQLGSPLRTTLRVGALHKPELELVAGNFPTRLERGSIIRNTFTLRNRGQGTASSVSLELLGSKDLQVPKTILIGDLAPGESRSYDLPLSIPAGFREDSVWIRGRIADLSLDYTKVVDWKLPIVGEAPSVPIKENQKTDYLTAVWLHPNPDHYDGRAIVWTENAIQVQVKAVSNKVLDKPNFCLEVNDQPCGTGAKMDEVSLKGSPYSRTFSQWINLKEGVTKIRMRVHNEAGKMETEPVQIVYSPRKPNLHLVSIGVPAVDLKYTHRDARDFAQKLLASNGRNNTYFQSIFVDTLVEEKTTSKTEILKTLRRLQYRFADRQIAPQDLILVFISSHGINTPQGIFHIAASDYDGPFLQETSLDFEKEMIQYLASIKCRKLFLLDACHSGAGSSDYTSFQLNDERINALTRGQKELNLLMSCQANEYSYEDDQWQHGAFTQAMLSAIDLFTRGTSGIDLNQDGALDLQELYQHLSKEVPRLVQTKRPKPQTSQQPLLVKDPLSSPIVLFQLPKK